MKKRLLATLLSLAMVLTMLPVTAFATETADLTFTAKTKTGSTDTVTLTFTADDVSGGTVWYKLATDKESLTNPSTITSENSSEYKTASLNSNSAEITITANDKYVAAAYVATDANPTGTVSKWGVVRIDAPAALTVTYNDDTREISVTNGATIDGDTLKYAVFADDEIPDITTATEVSEFSDWNELTNTAKTVAKSEEGTLVVVKLSSDGSSVEALGTAATPVTKKVRVLTVTDDQNASVELKDFTGEETNATTIPVTVAANAKTLKVTATGLTGETVAYTFNSALVTDTSSGFTLTDNTSDTLVITFTKDGASVAYTLTISKESAETTLVPMTLTLSREAKNTVKVSKAVEKENTTTEVSLTAADTTTAIADTALNLTADNLTTEKAKITDTYADAGITKDVAGKKHVNVIKEDATNKKVWWGTAEIPVWVEATIDNTITDESIVIKSGTASSFVYTTGATITVVANNGVELAVLNDDGTANDTYTFKAGTAGTTTTEYTLTLNDEPSADLTLKIGAKPSESNRDDISVTKGSLSSTVAISWDETNTTEGTVTANTGDELTISATGASIKVGTGNATNDTATVTVAATEQTVTVTFGTGEDAEIYTITVKAASGSDKNIEIGNVTVTNNEITVPSTSAEQTVKYAISDAELSGTFTTDSTWNDVVGGTNVTEYTPDTTTEGKTLIKSDANGRYLIVAVVTEADSKLVSLACGQVTYTDANKIYVTVSKTEDTDNVLEISETSIEIVNGNATIEVTVSGNFKPVVATVDGVAPSDATKYGFTSSGSTWTLSLTGLTANTAIAIKPEATQQSGTTKHVTVIKENTSDTSLTITNAEIEIKDGSAKIEVTVTGDVKPVVVSVDGEPLTDENKAAYEFKQDASDAKKYTLDLSNLTDNTAIVIKSEAIQPEIKNEIKVQDDAATPKDLITFAEGTTEYTVLVEAGVKSVTIAATPDTAVITGAEDGVVAAKAGEVTEVTVKFGDETYTIKLVWPKAAADIVEGDTTVDTTAAVKADKATLDLSAKEDEVLVAISNTKTANANAEPDAEAQPVIISAKVAEGAEAKDTTEVTLPAAVSDALVQAEVAAEIQTDVGTVTLSSEAVEAAKEDSPAELTVVVANKTPAQPEEDSKEVARFEVTVKKTVDGQTSTASISELENPVKLLFRVLKTAVTGTPSDLRLAYVKGTKYEALKDSKAPTEDEKTHEYIFEAETDHLSDFAIVDLSEIEEPEDPDEPVEFGFTVMDSKGNEITLTREDPTKALYNAETNETNIVVVVKGAEEGKTVKVRYFNNAGQVVEATSTADGYSVDLSQVRTENVGSKTVRSVEVVHGSDVHKIYFMEPEEVTVPDTITGITIGDAANETKVTFTNKVAEVDVPSDEDTVKFAVPDGAVVKLNGTALEAAAIANGVATVKLTDAAKDVITIEVTENGASATYTINLNKKSAATVPDTITGITIGDAANETKVTFTEKVANVDVPSDEDTVKFAVPDGAVVKLNGTALEAAAIANGVATVKLTDAAKDVITIEVTENGASATYYINLNKKSAETTTLTVKQTDTKGGLALVKISGMTSGKVYVIESVRGDAKIYTLIPADKTEYDTTVTWGNVVRVKEYTSEDVFYASGTANTVIKLVTVQKGTPTGTPDQD